MENPHGPHHNPKLLESASNYAKYSPLEVCTIIHEQYGDLFTDKAWPALTEHIPESNLGGVGEQQERNGMKCHSCSSEYHL